MADMVAGTLEDWGVDPIFGLSGDGINGFFEALRQRQKSMRFIHVRHEEVRPLWPAPMTILRGSWESAQELPGREAIHLLNGLFDAKLDGVPVLAISGQTYNESHYQQEVNLLQLYSDVASAGPYGDASRRGAGSATRSAQHARTGAGEAGTGFESGQIPGARRAASRPHCVNHLPR